MPPSLPAIWGGRVAALLRAGYIDRARVQADFDAARALRAPADLFNIWDKLHLAFGMLWCFMMGWPISFMEIAIAPLAVLFLMRLWYIRAALRWHLLFPATLLGIAWVHYEVLSLLWSPDPALGAEQILVARFSVGGLMLWPLMEHRAKLIGALACGFLCTNLSQLANQIGVEFHVPALTLKDQITAFGRNGGWWPSVFAGENLAAALGLHLPAAVLGRGRSRILGIAGSIVTTLGIAATGTRSGWIVTAGLFVVVLTVGLVRIRDPRRRGATLLTACVTLLLAAGTVELTLHDRIAARVDTMRQQWRDAFEHNNFDSADGSRLAMALWSLRAFRQHPVIGLGAGGYAAWVQRTYEGTGDTGYEWFHRHGFKHGHNAILQVASTGGMVGLLLAGALALAAVWAGFAPLSRDALGTYHAGPAFALLAMLMLTPFDAVHFNASTCSVLSVLIALCPPVMPSARRGFAGGAP